jgi:hypothetical protein
MKVTLNIDEAIVNELVYLVELQQKHGAPNPHASMESLLAYAAAALADGSRRPGSWERQLLEMMGLVPDTDKAQRYRAHYGRPTGNIDDDQ